MGHDWHVLLLVAANASENVPAPQRIHADAAELFDQLPCGHAVHPVEAFTLEKAPLRHPVQTEALASEKVPVRHARHEEALALEYSPAVHQLQLDELATAEKLPGWHPTHTDAPVGELSPTVHDLHTVAP